MSHRNASAPLLPLLHLLQNALNFAYSLLTRYHSRNAAKSGFYPTLSGIPPFADIWRNAIGNSLPLIAAALAFAANVAKSASSAVVAAPSCCFLLLNAVVQLAPTEKASLSALFCGFASQLPCGSLGGACRGHCGLRNPRRQLARGFPRSFPDARSCQIFAVNARLGWRLRVRPRKNASIRHFRSF